MKKEEIIKFINENPVCNLSSTEKKQPHVRGMMAYRADEEGIIFHTGRSKDLYKQLIENPLVEISFLNPQTHMQIRVKGKAVIQNDDNLKKEIIEARQYLKPWVDKMGLDILIVFKVVGCHACIWTFETNFAPKEYINFSS